MVVVTGAGGPMCRLHIILWIKYYFWVASCATDRREGTAVVRCAVVVVVVVVGGGVVVERVCTLAHTVGAVDSDGDAYLYIYRHFHFIFELLFAFICAATSSCLRRLRGAATSPQIAQVIATAITSVDTVTPPSSSCIVFVNYYR